MAFFDDMCQLHCTILNTTYRKPKLRDGKRVPISYSGLIDAPFFSLASDVMVECATSEPSRSRTLKRVNFGTYDIDELQICKMGSWGQDGEYVSVDRIPLGAE